VKGNSRGLLERRFQCPRLGDEAVAGHVDPQPMGGTALVSGAPMINGRTIVTAHAASGAGGA
jgi:hypothetical protein